MNDSIISKEQYFFFLDAGIPYEGWVDFGDGKIAWALKTVEVVSVPINKYNDKFITLNFVFKCVVDSTSNTASKKNGYDINKAIDNLNEKAKPGSIGSCAKYVRLAIEAGGLPTEGRPVGATDYDKFLPKLGFNTVDSTNYIPQKGDIVVFKAFQGKNKYHQYGHIQMYNGSQWVSDFKQRDFWAGSDYRIYKPEYVIFRWQ
jgi:signal peptidase I